MAGKKGNEFGNNWWAKRWNSVLESFGWSNRLQRGRAYARNGNVLDIGISTGIVAAKVRGSLLSPYIVQINTIPFTEEKWDRVVGIMASKAIFSVKLLAGEMPHNIEEAFEKAGLSLFPDASYDLETECSCPDWANPCKHIAAVYYILGHRFNNDPFLIFRLRGKNKEQLMEELRLRRTGEKPGIRGKEGSHPVSRGKKHPSLEKLVDKFWEPAEKLHESFSIEPSGIRYSALKRLGTPDFWKSAAGFTDTLSLFYDKAEERIKELMEKI